jgi:hypothetical protein
MVPRKKKSLASVTSHRMVAVSLFGGTGDPGPDGAKTGHNPEPYVNITPQWAMGRNSPRYQVSGIRTPPLNRGRAVRWANTLYLKPNT